MQKIVFEIPEGRRKGESEKKNIVVGQEHPQLGTLENKSDEGQDDRLQRTLENEENGGQVGQDEINRILKFKQLGGILHRRTDVPRSGVFFEVYW